MARPKKSVDAKLVQKLAAIACSIKDIALMAGCSVDTLERRFADEIAKGRAECRTTLRRRQWEAAMDGNTALLIFLGKNLLGQTDRTDVTSAGETISPMEVYPISQKRWAIPDNGRSVDPAAQADNAPPSPPSRSTRPVRSAPPNGGGPPGFLWPDGSRRVLPPPE